jgi:hypothetical protein
MAWLLDTNVLSELRRLRSPRGRGEGIRLLCTPQIFT